jgi:hypothetical protein
LGGKKDGGLGLLAGGLLGAGIIYMLSRPANAECQPGHHKDPVTGLCVPDSAGTILTVKAVTSTGTEIPGMFAQVYDATGTTVIAEGSTPLDVSVSPGTVVSVTLHNYQQNVFSYWQDSFDIDRTLRVVNIAQSTVLAGVYSQNGIPIPPPTTGDNRTLTVASIDQHGLPVTGMAVDVMVGTVTTSEGYTPHIAQVRASTTVGVSVTQSYTDNNPDSPNFGTVWTFKNWTDGVTTNSRTVTINGNITVTAIYEVTTNGSTVPPPNSSPLTVNAYILGSNTPVAVPARITRVATGSIIDVTTPHTINAIQGEQYLLEMLNGDGLQFTQWGNGSTQPLRAVTIGTVPDTKTGYYTRTDIPAGSVAVTVASANLAGQPLGSFFATLYSGGLVAETGFTPAVFNLVPGQNYEISVADFGTSTFQRWSDGVLTRRRPINVSAPTTFTAIYNTA